MNELKTLLHENEFFLTVDGVLCFPDSSGTHQPIEQLKKIEKYEGFVCYQIETVPSLAELCLYFERVLLTMTNGNLSLYVKEAMESCWEMRGRLSIQYKNCAVGFFLTAVASEHVAVLGCNDKLFLLKEKVFEAMDLKRYDVHLIVPGVYSSPSTNTSVYDCIREIIDELRLIAKARATEITENECLWCKKATSSSPVRCMWCRDFVCWVCDDCHGRRNYCPSCRNLFGDECCDKLTEFFQNLYLFK